MSAPSPDPQWLRRRLAGINVYLVGMMGAGKSAVGRPLAQALGYRFVDADTMIEKVAGRPIASLFANEGEAGFRRLETAVLGQIAGWHSLVVATGGGVVSCPQNWGHMHQGVVVWLDAPAEVLLSRLSADPTSRPLLQCNDPAARLQTLLQERLPLYAQADLRICQGEGTAEQVARQVMEGLPSILKRPEPDPPPPLTLLDAEGQSLTGIN